MYTSIFHTLNPEDTGLPEQYTVIIRPYIDGVHIQIEDNSLSDDANPVAHVTLRPFQGKFTAVVQDGEQLERGEGEDHRLTLSYPTKEATCPKPELPTA